SAHRVLTFAEEQAFGRRIDAGCLAESMLALENDTARRSALLRLITDGKKAKEDLAGHNLRLVVSVAAKLQTRCTPALTFEDLVQEGYLGLAHAIDKWEYQRGLKFSTYAIWWIRQSITRAIDDKARAI